MLNAMCKSNKIVGITTAWSCLSWNIVGQGNGGDYRGDHSSGHGSQVAFIYYSNKSFIMIIFNKLYSITYIGFYIDYLFKSFSTAKCFVTLSRRNNYRDIAVKDKLDISSLIFQGSLSSETLIIPVYDFQL